jgi:hypothetical protein
MRNLWLKLTCEAREVPEILLPPAVVDPEKREVVHGRPVGDAIMAGR